MRRLCLAALLAAACADGSRTVAHTELTLTDPADGAAAFSRDDLAVRAHASDNHLVKSVALVVGTRAARTCAFDPPVEDASCETTVAPADFAAQVQAGRLTVRAHAVNADGDETDRTADVVVTPLVVRFASPAPPGPVNVRGTSRLAFTVRAEVPARLVAVTYDDGLPLRQWDTEPYQDDVDWQAFVGVGPHALVATVTDANQRTAQARLDVVVACAADAECARGLHCCGGTCLGACP